MNKTIYDLNLHEQLWISNELIITKVDSGWNYSYYVWRNTEYGGDYTLLQVVFVPFRELHSY